MDLGLKGRRAVVTGATSGIGRACAMGLAAEGAVVHLVARTEAGLSSMEELLREGGAAASSSAADLSLADDADRACREAVEAMGGVDILINSAGAAQRENVLELSRQRVLDGFELKALGYLRMAQGVAPLMVEQRWGRIVNIAGGSGASPSADTLPLSFANAAVLNLTRALSDELSPHGVLVNVVCPGVIDTPRAGQLYTDEALAELEKRLPARRVGRPEEVAAMACFLASSACTYVHGTSIYMDGGGRRATP